MKNEKKDLIEFENLRHKNRMLEIETEKLAKIECLKIGFDFKLQLQRIKSAEIRKNQERRLFN